MLRWTELLKLRRKRHQQPQIRRALEDGPSACPFGSGSVFVLETKSGLFDGRRGRRKAPSRMEVTLGGPRLMPAANSTTWVRDGARWAAPRTARRAVVGLGVARRPAWSRHAAPIVTRGRHAFTEAGRVHGSWRAPRRRFAAAITPSLVSGTPPPSIPCGVSSDLTRPSYPGAAPRSRPGASASGPLQLSASVCVLITLIYLSYTLPLNLQNYAAKGRRRFASAGAGSARGRLRRVRVCCL